MRELDTRLFKSSEVAKLRQINLNELQAKIRAERQVRVCVGGLGCVEAY